MEGLALFGRALARGNLGRSGAYDAALSTMSATGTLMLGARRRLRVVHGRKCLTPCGTAR
jgi:hypothetical protein